MSPKLKVEVVPVGEVPQEDTVVSLNRSQPLVLVVDDERVIADTLSMILSRSGFSTMTAYDGANALGLARNRRPDLLISDVMMPGMTGIELAITVTETIPGCKVLLFSGQAVMPKTLNSDAAVIEYVAHTPGAIAYIGKSVPHEGVKILVVR